LNSTNAGFQGDAQKIADMNDRIEQLESLAIAGMVFGIAGAAMVRFGACSALVC
jgi:ABC-type uncharacterized transport system permease subunit